MVKLTGAQIITRLLVQECVSQVYGVVGGKLGPLLHAISQTPSIKYLGVRNEASGAMMAAAHAAASVGAVGESQGRIAVALGEMGPGSLNLAAGLGTAAGNSLPVLAITTNQHRAASYPHSGMFMDLDTLAVMKPLCKWQAVVNDARRLPDLLRRAFREALSGRPGPVHLDIPQDVLVQEVEFDESLLDVAPERYRPVYAFGPSPVAITKAARVLKKAKRPLIIAGGGVIASDAQAELLQLADSFQAPVIPTQMALGVVPSDSVFFIGHGGIIAGSPVKEAIEHADVVISVGCRHSSWMWDEQGPLVRRSQHVISINIDASVLGQQVLHDVGIQSDAKLALAALLQETRRRPERPDALWLAQCKAGRAAYEATLSKLSDKDSTTPTHPAALAKALGELLPVDALAVFDGGHTSFWSNDLTPVSAIRTRFHDPGMCQLGFGLPYAIALQKLHSQRRVFNITGDGSFGFTLSELDTARRYQLPVINVIHNNAAWGIIQSGQKKQFDFELGTDLSGTDYAAIARGFGCFGARVERLDELKPALDQALASGLPAVLDCQVRFEPHPAMPLFGAMNRFGYDALTGLSSKQS